MRKKILVALVVIAVISVLSINVYGCVPRQASEMEADYENENVALELPVWSEESDCGSCHLTEEASETDQGFTYAKHYPQGVDCGQCHTDEDGKLAAAHEGYATENPPNRLKTTKVKDDTCLSCHNAESLKSQTSTSTVLKDLEETVVNPHDLPLVEDHLNNITCSDCHKMHKTVDLVKQAQGTCTSCHHAGVFRCGACH